MKMVQNYERLQMLAEDDLPCQAWMKAYQDARAEFEAYANEQPMLWAYAEGGRLMYQRLVNLACESMEFSEK